MDIDAALKYCPRCRDEYRAEIDSCVSCAIPLIFGAELLAATAGHEPNGGEPAPIGGTEEVVVLCAGSLLDMKRLRRELARKGIASLMVSDEQCRSGCRGPQIQLCIRPGDSAVAAALLREEHMRTTARHEFEEVAAEAVFDASGDEVSCPACGCRFTPEGEECPECGLCFL